MSSKEFLASYLFFGKKGRMGTLALLLLIAVIFFLPHFYPTSSKPLSIGKGAFLLKAIDTLAQGPTRYNYPNEEEPVQRFSDEPHWETYSGNGELFLFDPNTLSMEGWKKLGLNERTARIILNYQNKGGRFYKPEDLKKIWSLPAGFYERVKDHISITPVSKPFESTGLSKPVYEKPKREVPAININEADTAALIALPGIGSKLASRIVNFREKLGGFYAVDQIGETYGLPDSTFQKIKSYLQLKGDVKRISINAATKEELKSHPYIQWKLANAIVEYRNQHGNFKSLEDLKNIVIMDEGRFNKIVHYLLL